MTFKMVLHPSTLTNFFFIKMVLLELVDPTTKITRCVNSSLIRRSIVRLSIPMSSSLLSLLQMKIFEMDLTLWQIWSWLEQHLYRKIIYGMLSSPWPCGKCYEELWRFYAHGSVRAHQPWTLQEHPQSHMQSPVLCFTSIFSTFSALFSLHGVFEVGSHGFQISFDNDNFWLRLWVSLTEEDLYNTKCCCNYYFCHDLVLFIMSLPS